LRRTNELSDFPEADEVKQAIWDYADERGRGEVLWPLRYCLSGKDRSPDPFTLFSVLGKEESIKRINSAIEKINAISE
jgi:glutamyl-tRNA synthetase